MAAACGTDIQLGGNATCALSKSFKTFRKAPSASAAFEEIEKQVDRLKKKALAAGGLYVLGTERHESRRIDNQLRGRSGLRAIPDIRSFSVRSKTISMRIFGTDKLDTMLQRLGLKENEAIRPFLDQQGAGEGAAEGRGAQFRYS